LVGGQNWGWGGKGFGFVGCWTTSKNLNEPPKEVFLPNPGEKVWGRVSQKNQWGGG